MKIAVTGGSGGIGRAITDMGLAQGHGIVSIDRVEPKEPVSGVTYIQADAADYDALVAAFAGCDAVIHMAAIPSPGNHPDHVVHNNNVVGSYNALRAAVECGIMRICQASSVNAIGQAYSRVPRYDYFPIDEAALWVNLEYFLRRVLPVAEKAGVKLSMHPDDPPLSPIRGVGRIMRSVANY